MTQERPKHSKILYLGGVRSGKSSLAEARALELAGKSRPIYLATSLPLDPDMESRIRLHRERRDRRFETVEEPLRILDAVREASAPVLLECITLWINNMLYEEKSDGEILGAARELAALDRTIVFVQNEVGLGILPADSLSRKFADLSGQVSEILARGCDEVHLCTAGLSLRMK